MVLNKRVQGTRHKVSGPLNRDVGRNKYYNINTEIHYEGMAHTVI